MKTIEKIIQPNAVWVHPTQNVKTAIVILKAYNLTLVPVLENKKLVGIALWKNLVNTRSERPVRDVMKTDFRVAAPTLTAREAANLMTQCGQDYLPVVKDGELLGIITAFDLLTELRLASDPITDLPWSDTLREWAINSLRTGQEITLLFLDINDFGQFNKRFGHLTGDLVLQSVAKILREVTYLGWDSVCRYGGDEFCIASLRTSPQAEGLAKQIGARIADLTLPDVPERIRVTIGIYGGKRTREREHNHFVATLNDLINLASRDCLTKKRYAGRKIAMIDSDVETTSITPPLSESEFQHAMIEGSMV